MPKRRKLSASPELAAQIALHVMGWKDVHLVGESTYQGKKQDKAGRWRKSRVPDYCFDASLVSEVEERLKKLGAFDRYTKELSTIAHRDNLPEGWASPVQRCQAALNVVKSKGKTSTKHLKIVPKRGK
jgi:hypothetical protein